ncbi:MAG: YARHG domain-containing protein [Spirochaetaceae bacterium]|jgi:hypothetical protein|nr:YARHG domain-containing protein [Spirochaetaceae bacterium]
MKNTIVIILFLCSSLLGAEEELRVERLARTGEIVRQLRIQYAFPHNLVADEAALRVVIPTRHGPAVEFQYRPGSLGGAWGVEPLKTDDYDYALFQFDLGAWRFIGDWVNIAIMERGTNRALARDDETQGLVAFILKNGDGLNYSMFYVHRGDLFPRAMDTGGRRYQGREVMDLLRSIDPEKYRASLLRAEELGLGERFLNGEVLVWGRTHYQDDDYWYQYDLDGLKYYLAGLNVYEPAGHPLYFRAYGHEGQLLEEINVTPFSELLQSADPRKIESSLYTGFGGNVYFFFAGPEYTEVFRIRRTWGEPNLYALAVNGYTEDDYGRYVRRVLSQMSAPDLALLRNHLFALEGLPFRRPEYREYFERQVWYSPRDIRQEDITLVDIRQALLELIQTEEHARQAGSPPR